MKFIQMNGNDIMSSFGLHQLSGSLEETLARFRDARVTVFGDFSLDAYWTIAEDCDERSLETGLPIRRIRQQRYNLGGAGNIVANLLDLGVQHVYAIGVVGNDPFGVELLRLLSEKGADISGMHMNGGCETMVYAKPIFEDAEENRLDFGAFNSVPAEVVDRLMAALNETASKSDVVVLNQQIPSGVSTPEVIARLNDVIASHAHTQFIVDARHRAVLFDGAILKLNSREACVYLEEPVSDETLSCSNAESYARRISLRTGYPVFLTRGENGILVVDRNEVIEVPGVQIIERIDPVGAGDTVVATLAAVLATGGDASLAATLANIAASVTVRKIQTTGTATPDEILAVGTDRDHIYRPELASDPRRSTYFEDTEIEIVSELPSDIRIRHAIFDHDGTLSTLREGWEKTMEPMMIRAVLGTRYADVDDSLYNKAQRMVRQLIDKTTGIQTLVQMQSLRSLVLQFGLVPADQVLDEHGYKHIYNEQLLAVVSQRLKKLASGELVSEDFQIKNAYRLLKHLYDRGVKLYLASGTDKADVIAEAQGMGYANLFEGRIYGAVGDVRIEAKKMVLDRIIRENQLLGHEFVTFGDGPVEIRETHKRGGITVGVASDELRRFGMNLAKRTRLIRAGADLIVPDFSQAATLLEMLGLA
ncbi:MAG: PfkB family carbohydrate kinase [Terracidiphilus sp.]|nr:PfkB family carbohydrate kinase [Terracidiphilus sp.]